VGGAVAQRFAREGLHIVVSGRQLPKVEETAEKIVSDGGSAEAIAADVTSAEDIHAVFNIAARLDQPVSSVIYNAGSNFPIPFEELTADQFEEFWRISCFGAFLVAKQAMPILAKQGFGSALFTGASASMRGRPMFGHFASAKAGLRNLLQALAREYGPQGVHIAHVIIDGVVNGDRVKTLWAERLAEFGEDATLEPEAIAEAFWTLHTQHRSTWTHELELRSFKEYW
jgi:NAD(P)-dependent dehydrogenase (short-subunit alcohol dehydrogenase family)